MCQSLRNAGVILPDRSARAWRVDETYIRVRGRWADLYRAVDKQGLTVDFLLSEHRDIAAARQFFIQAIKKHDAPEKITVDGYRATHTAISELQAEGQAKFVAWFFQLAAWGNDSMIFRNSN